MTWIVDYSIVCNACNRDEPASGYTKAQCAREMREAGWYVSGQTAYCPDCRSKQQNGAHGKPEGEVLP